MAYDDIYKGLSPEDRERMLKQDIPKFERVPGHYELTEEQKLHAADFEEFVQSGGETLGEFTAFVNKKKREREKQKRNNGIME